LARFNIAGTPRSGKPGWLHPLMSRGFISGLRMHSNLGLRRLNRQISHTDQVVACGCEGEDPSHLENPAMPNLPQQRDSSSPSNQKGRQEAPSLIW
jgi:hypothetical protein